MHLIDETKDELKQEVKKFEKKLKVTEHKLASELEISDHKKYQLNSLIEKAEKLNQIGAISNYLEKATKKKLMNTE